MRFTCDHTETILARFLDGDNRTCQGPHPLADLLADPPGDPLAGHLDRCADCRDALRRARRLDALLAQHSAVAVTDEQADRLFVAALPATPGRARRRLPKLLASAVLLTVGFGIGWFAFRAREPVPPPPARVAMRQAKSVGDDLLALPNPARRLRRSRTGPAAAGDVMARAATLLRRDDLVAELLPGVVVAATLDLTRTTLTPSARLGAAWQTWVAASRRAATLADTLRTTAGRRLMRGRRAADRRVFLAFLATAEDGPVLRALLADARDHRATTRRLRRALGTRRVDPATLRIAARLGTKSIDDGLLRLVQKDPERADEIAAAAADLRVRPGAVDLLLDLWTGLRTRRPRSSEPEQRAAAWFRSLPANAAADLQQRATTARRIDRRLQCLAALGWRRDPATLPFLLQRVEGNHHEVAIAAGLALSRMPRDRCEKLVAARVKRSKRHHVLLAALCGMGSRLPHPLLRSIRLTVHEAEFLFGGDFTTTQFAIACDLCRRRSLLSD